MVSQRISGYVCCLFFGAVRAERRIDFFYKPRMYVPTRLLLRFLTALTAALIFATGANAQAPSWRFEQLYSNANLDIQFLVLVESLGEPNGNNQNAVTGLQIGSVHNDNDGASRSGIRCVFHVPQQPSKRRDGGAPHSDRDPGLRRPRSHHSGLRGGKPVPGIQEWSPAALPGIHHDTLRRCAVSRKFLPTARRHSFRDAPNQRPNVAVNFAGQSASVPATPASSPTGWRWSTTTPRGITTS
jgi:hypothetical protein